MPVYKVEIPFVTADDASALRLMETLARMARMILVCPDILIVTRDGKVINTEFKD